VELASRMGRRGYTATQDRLRHGGVVGEDAVDTAGTTGMVDKAGMADTDDIEDKEDKETGGADTGHFG
jgi:hypothetical protein